MSRSENPQVFRINPEQNNRGNGKNFDRPQQNQGGKQQQQGGKQQNQPQRDQPRPMQVKEAEFFQKVVLFYLPDKDEFFFVPGQEFYNRRGDLINLASRPLAAGAQPSGYMYVTSDDNGVYAPYYAHRYEQPDAFNFIDQNVRKFQDGLLDLIVWAESTNKKRPSRTTRAGKEVLVNNVKIPRWVKIALATMFVLTLVVVFVLIQSTRL